MKSSFSLRAACRTALLTLTLIHHAVNAEGTTNQQLLGDLNNPDDQRIQLHETDRVNEYHKRKYSWPLQTYVPDTPGWRELMGKRIEQVQEIQDRGERYEGFIQAIRTAHLVQNFTATGFGLARCPDELLGALQQGIREGLPDASREYKVNIIDGPQALFVNRPDLTARVLQELKHYAETWANGVELTPYRAYGFRLYQNNSQLHMHVDKVQTHIVSFILHIDSSEDAEPWPIFIEDFNGRTHEVILTPGDILFYESSKMWHGRPKRLNGSWYCSVFVHYYPSNNWYDTNHALESHYAVPPEWSNEPPAVRRHPRLKMVGTSMTEPECPNDWCATESSVKWSGPGEEGVWIGPDGEKYPFNPRHESWNEEL